MRRYYAIQGPREYTVWVTTYDGYVGSDPPVAGTTALTGVATTDEPRTIARALAEQLQVIHTAGTDRWRVRVFAGEDRDDIRNAFTYGPVEANEDGLYCGFGNDPRHDLTKCPGLHP